MLTLGWGGGGGGGAAVAVFTDFPNTGKSYMPIHVSPLVNQRFEC